MKSLLIGALLMTGASYAQTRANYAHSTGGGNGGQTIYRGNNAYLRDITEKNNCIWKRYDQIVKEEPTLGQILTKTYALNSSFTYRIEEELASLGYCYTTKRLPYLQYNNSDDIHIFANQEYDQVAINDSGIVFIDVNIFSKMDNVNRAYLFMHESAHELFNKQESRSNREPRLREFLMNLFEQLDVMYRNQNTDSFDYIISQAKFTALEPVTTLNKKDFETMFLNDPAQKLAEKVSALKGLKYTTKFEGIFSHVLKQNIQDIENQRLAMIGKILSGTSLATTKANFPKLVKAMENVGQYIYGDAEKLQTLNDAITSMIEDEDLTSDIESLEKAFALITLRNGNTFVAGNVAKNYDAVAGAGMFLNKIAEDSSYLETLIFGKVYIEASTRSVRCKPFQGAGNGQCWDTITTNYTYYKSDLILGNQEKGLINGSSAANSLVEYVLTSLKYNKWFANKLLAVLEKDVQKLNDASYSDYTLPVCMKINDDITKNGKLRSGAKFSGVEKKEQIRIRQVLINKLKSL